MATGSRKGDRGEEGVRNLSRLGIFKHELSRIFTNFLLLLYKKRDKVKMDWRRWASIARLSIRKMCCPNGSRKLLTQKIIIRSYQAGPAYFPHEVRFSAGIGPAHFLAETTRPLGPRLSAFSPTCPSFYIEGYLFLTLMTVAYSSSTIYSTLPM